MSDNSKIEWTDATWNPVRGCTKISPGCKLCYAERLSQRLNRMGVKKYENGFQLTLHESVLDLPLTWKQPRLIFVNSMSDLFHEQIPDRFIQRVFAIMREASWHRFQVLTKRSERLFKLTPDLKWADNIWMGVSVESAAYSYRIDHLRHTQAKVKFLSLEPLLGPIPSLDLTGIQWVIVGGESGPGARPIDRDWVVQIRNQCTAEQVPFFFKQWGGEVKKKSGRLLEGRTWDEFPKSLLTSQAVQTAEMVT